MDLLPKNNISRKIIHIDMDAFYASVEMRDNPNIRDKAVLIGGRSEEHTSELQSP